MPPPLPKKTVEAHPFKTVGVCELGHKNGKELGLQFVPRQCACGNMTTIALSEPDAKYLVKLLGEALRNFHPTNN